MTAAALPIVAKFLLLVGIGAALGIGLSHVLEWLDQKLCQCADLDHPES